MRPPPRRDTQGHELRVLRRARGVLQRDAPTLFYEDMFNTGARDRNGLLLRRRDVLGNETKYRCACNPEDCECSTAYLPAGR